MSENAKSWRKTCHVIESTPVTLCSGHPRRLEPATNRDHFSDMPRPSFLASSLLAALLVLAPGAARALTDAEQAEVARIEAYLESVRSIRADFVQVTSSGAFAEGEFRLRRPGKLRLDYKPPSNIQVYADGTWLIYVDTRLAEVTYIPIGSTIVGFLVRNKLSLSDDVRVVALDRGPDVLTLHIVQAKEPDAGRLALTFSRSPLQLRQWTVLDAQGIETRVTLVGAETNVAIGDEVFAFDGRKYERPIRE
jgi:outer membrane lipoprotein-sorting protein